MQIWVIEIISKPMPRILKQQPLSNWIYLAPTMYEILCWAIKNYTYEKNKCFLRIVFLTFRKLVKQ